MCQKKKNYGDRQILTSRMMISEGSQDYVAYTMSLKCIIIGKYEYTWSMYTRKRSYSTNENIDTCFKNRTDSSKCYIHMMLYV